MGVKAHFLALLLGFCLDLLLGDPQWAPHPVRGMGALIAGLEKPLRRAFPKTPRGERMAGRVLVVLAVGLPTGLTILVCWLCGRIHPWLAFGVETLLSYQLLATRALARESGRVYRALTQGGLEEARRAVSYIVGRDTDCLDRAGVTRAAVETVAENASDGVIAPFLFLALGGAPLGMAYKAVNTLDSMVGYQNQQYLNFGRCAARLDDLVNFLPARISGVLMCLGAALAGFDGKSAWAIFLRDRRNHKSPNSAHTEAAAAGALHLRLAGSNYYFGKLVVKPTIGDDLRPIEPEDIRRANRILYVTAALCAALFGLLPLILLTAL